MHLVTAQSAAPSFPALPDGTRLSGKPHADNGVAWQLYEHKTSFLFGFITDKGFIGTAEHETAPRAEKAARRWCAAFVAEPVFEPALALEVPDSTMMPKGAALEVVGAEAFDAAVFGEPAAAEDQDLVGGWLITTRVDGDRYAADLTDPTGASTGPDWLTNYKTEVAARTGGKLWAKTNPATEHRFSAGHRVDPAPAPAIEPLGTHEIAGWRIEVSEGRPGTFKAELFHATTGKAGALDQNFTGKDSARTALTDASIWAMQHAADVPRISAKIDGEVVDLEEIHGEADPETELWETVRESLGEEVPGTGWYVATVDGKRGTFNAHLLREDGVVCPERFDGHTTPDGAAAEACEWARANPCWTSTFDVPPHVIEHEIAVAAAEDARAVAALDADEPTTPDAEAAGWRIFATATGDKWALDIIDAATGDRAQTGGAWGPWHDTRDDAVEAGTTWAIANPTDAAVAEANELWSHVDAARRPALEADMSRVADRLDQDATDLRAELARVTRERDEARAAHARDTKACNAVAVDLAWNTKRKGELEARIADDRDELKSVVKRLKELETEVKETLEAVGKGKQVPLFPTVTIEGQKVSSPTVTSVTFTAGDRKKLDAELRHHDGQRPAVFTTTWHHGGVDYALESVELPGGQWRSCIHGHEATTEAFERSRDEAETNCKAAAVIVFEKMGAPTHEWTREAAESAYQLSRHRVQVEATIDPVVRMPAKRGRKPKLGGHDLDAVKAAMLGGSMLDAAMTLGVTPQQLQKFSEKNLPGLAAVDLGEHAVADGHFIHDDGAEPEGGGGLPDAADAIVCGWRVIVGNDARDDGAFMVECVAQETGVVVGGAGDFAGFNGTEEAAEYGRKYARENPTPSYAAAHEVVESWQGADALALGDSAEVARLPAPAKRGRKGGAK